MTKFRKLVTWDTNVKIQNRKYRHEVRNNGFHISSLHVPNNDRRQRKWWSMIVAKNPLFLQALTTTNPSKDGLFPASIYCLQLKSELFIQKQVRISPCTSGKRARRWNLWFTEMRMKNWATMCWATTGPSLKWLIYLINKQGYSLEIPYVIMQHMHSPVTIQKHKTWRP